MIGAYHFACFGEFWRTGYQFIQRVEFARGHASGLLGVHVANFEALVRVARRRAARIVFSVSFRARRGARCSRREETATVSAGAGLVAFLALLMANGGYYMWWGAAAGLRHLVPVLGFLRSAPRWPGIRRSLRWLFVLLALVSFMNMLALTAVGLEGPEYGNLLFDYAYRRLLNGQIGNLSGASTLAIRLGLARGATLGPIRMWVLLGGRFSLRHVDAGTDVEPLADAGASSGEPAA